MKIICQHPICEKKVRKAISLVKRDNKKNLFYKWLQKSGNIARIWKAVQQFLMIWQYRIQKNVNEVRNM